MISTKPKRAGLPERGGGVLAQTWEGRLTRCFRLCQPAHSAISPHSVCSDSVESNLLVTPQFWLSTTVLTASTGAPSALLQPPSCTKKWCVCVCVWLSASDRLKLVASKLADAKFIATIH